MKFAGDGAVAVRAWGLGAVLAACGPALGQYGQDFDGLASAPTGFPLVPQDAFYVPAVGGTSTNVYPYVGNTVLIPPNLFGGTQFTAGNAAPNRSQRDITWPGGIIKVSFDFCANNTGVQVNNIGSFSAQPHAAPATNRTFIILASYPTPPLPGLYDISYIMFSPANAIDPGAGRIVWPGLLIDTWYRLETTINFHLNKVVGIALTNLTTLARQEQDLSGADFYLGGGAVPPFPPMPTGFRLFNGVATNVSAFDNVNVCPCACDWDTTTGAGVCDIFDFLAFQNGFAAGAFCACNMDASTGPDMCDIFDFLAYQNDFAGDCD